MGKTSNPHRIFALGGVALGVAAMVYLGATPEIIKASGREALFWVFAAIMAIAALVNTAFFPSVELTSEAPRAKTKFSKQVWLLIAAIMLMALNNSMILSFAERVGEHRAFGAGQVQTALITMALVAIFAPILSAVLQNRFNTGIVAIIGSVVHGGLALGIMTFTDFSLFMGVLIFFPAAILFTHTFVFGTLAEQEPSGRAVAATPAMLMTGSAVGPFLGGAIVQGVGYDALGYLAFALSVLSMALFMMSTRAGSPASAAAQ